jgi:hypothetical protein
VADSLVIFFEVKVKITHLAKPNNSMYKEVAKTQLKLHFDTLQK